jgi:hypothetical protein
MALALHRRRDQHRGRCGAGAQVRPESPIKTPSRVDFVGATLLSGGLIAMLVALTEGDSWGWTSGLTLGLGALAVILFVAWGIAELRVPEPMVDMRMLAVRPVLFTNLTALVAGFAMFGTFVLVPNFVETPHGLPRSVQRLVDYGFDASATKAASTCCRARSRSCSPGPIAGLIGRRTGSKWPLSVGLVLVSGRRGGARDLERRVVADPRLDGRLGIGVGFAFAAMATLITEAVRPSETASPPA